MMKIPEYRKNLKIATKEMMKNLEEMFQKNWTIEEDNQENDEEGDDHND